MFKKYIERLGTDKVRGVQFTKNSFQEKQFKAEHPDIYSQYLSEVEIDYPRISGRK